jgi:hypothetical protein
MREQYRQTGKKIKLYLKADHPAEYYKGATHPTKNSEGEFVCLNEKMIEMMLPLYRVQPFIDEVKLWEGEPIDWDLNAIRMVNVGMPHTSINRWYFYAFPNLTCDLSEVWMEVPDSEKDFAKGKILINRTERYHAGDHIDFGFIKPFEDDCLFIGTMREYNNFCMNYDLNIRKINVNDFLEYAQAVKQCKFYLSNQSQGFQIAEGLKKPRILETCISATNVTPIGKDAYDFISQHGLEYAFHILNGSLKPYIAAKIEELKKASESKALDEVNSATN